MRFYWIRKLFGLKNRNARRSKPVRVRPRLEALEDRTLLSLTWSVQSDYFDAQGAANQPWSLRGLALSSDNTSLYGGFIQGPTTSAAIREVSTTGAGLIGNDGAQFGNAAYTTGLEAKVTTSAQAKGLATDDRGNVYATLNSGSNSTTQGWAIYNSTLSSQESSKVSTNAQSSQLSGIATVKIGSDYYAYVAWKNGQIERWNVDNVANPVLDTSWGNSGIINLQTINSNAYLDGLTVDTNGDIYVAGSLDANGTTSYGDALIKITAAEAASGNITAATSVAVKGGADGSGGYSAMDVALFNNQAYVTEYLAGDSTIAVFNTSDLSNAGIITPTNPTGPSGLNATFSPTAPDSGFSGIDIGTNGQIYVAEQLYNSSTDYTPPGGTEITGQTIYFDRIMVSSAQVVAPTITSGNSTTFTVGTAGSFTVTATGVITPSLTESGALPSGVTFVDNGDGTATLSGTPAAGTGGVYSLTITASNGTSPDATQTFTLTDDEAPAITSANSTTFTVGTAGSFTVTTSGYPTSSLSETGALPSGVTFVDKGDGTATLAGTPAAGSGGTYSFTITASNGVAPNATQTFTLTDDEAPTITSANSTTFVAGTAGSFTVTTGHSFPANAALSESGALPSGVT
ncbi:MAG: beta strand repeat-containing protein, partial [Gemmataceae bacterium]